MSQTLESDCDELMLRMRRPLNYSTIDSSDEFYETKWRRCSLCPSEYVAFIYRAAEEDVCGDEEEYYPYYIQFRRYVDLGDWWQREGESEEFKALTAGQVCCDHVERAAAPPKDCLWQGRDWSTIPCIQERADRRLSIGMKTRRAWYRFLDCIFYKHFY